jgi:hypothetical protein
MTKLFETLLPEAKEELIRDGVVELVTVVVEVEPDPARPDNRNAMNIVIEVYDNFRDGIPAIEAGRTRIRSICDRAPGDLSDDTRENLIAALARRCDEMDELQEGRVDGQPVDALRDPAVAKFFTPELFTHNKKVTVWCYAWTVGMEDSGMMDVDCEEPLYDAGIDTVSRARIRERAEKVNGELNRIVAPLLQGR